MYHYRDTVVKNMAKFTENGVPGLKLGLSYKPPSGLNFARYTGQSGSYLPSSPLGVYKPLALLHSWGTWPTAQAVDACIAR